VARCYGAERDILD